MATEQAERTPAHWRCVPMNLEFKHDPVEIDEGYLGTKPGAPNVLGQIHLHGKLQPLHRRWEMQMPAQSCQGSFAFCTTTDSLIIGT